MTVCAKSVHKTLVITGGPTLSTDLGSLAGAKAPRGQHDANLPGESLGTANRPLGISQQGPGHKVAQQAQSKVLSGLEDTMSLSLHLGLPEPSGTSVQSGEEQNLLRP